jgi:hypothetical protein
MNQSKSNAGENPSTQRNRDLDRVCDEFEAGCKSGASPRIEQYLDPAPRSNQPQLLAELLRLELSYLLERGELRQPNDYIARFAGHSQTIAAVFEEFGKRARPEAASLETTRSLGRLFGPGTMIDNRYKLLEELLSRRESAG